MSYSQPSPPAELPDEIVQTLTQYSREQLRDVASYAEALAEHRERKARLEEADGSEGPDLNDDLPEEVPSKASITIKNINGNRYYYWQWREGEKIKSKYKGPVDGS